MNIKENILKIQEEIREAVGKSHRKDNVKLVAVSKTFPAEYIAEAFNCGISDFGENYVQEFVAKQSNLIDLPINWHFIGHLQTNKIKYVFDKITLLHTLDSLKLAEKINKKLQQSDKKLSVLIQINIGKEESKYGIFPEEVEHFVENLYNMKSLIVTGLMTIPPYFEDAEKARSYFIKMRELLEKVKRFNSDNIHLKELSMGMSHDFKVAIEEGATIVRIGSAIFGERTCSMKMAKNL